jgi:hypothetical protein
MMKMLGVDQRGLHAQGLELLQRIERVLDRFALAAVLLAGQSRDRLE